MHVLIGIATYKHPEGLKKLLQSIEKQTYSNFRVLVVFDNNDTDGEQVVSKYKKEIDIQVLQDRNYTAGCWNRVYQTQGFDAYMTLGDSVELFPDCIEKAVQSLQNNFSNLDGVIGITQLYPSQEGVFFQPAGQVLVGRTFLERFKPVDYQLWCPNYTQLYKDVELLEYASSLNKFVLAYDAQLIYRHPSIYSENSIDTADNSITKKIDKDIYLARKRENLLWGKSWKKI